MGYPPRPTEFGLTATEDNVYAGTSEGEIFHFLLDKLSDTENVLPTSV